MISADDRDKLIAIARRHGATEVRLFGSAADPDRFSEDIDVAVAGIRPEQFFALYGELLMALSKPVDLIDLSHQSPFVAIIRAEGELIG